MHCVKSFRIWSFSGPEKYGKIRSISPYLVRMRENTDQKNFDYGHFSHNGDLQTFLANAMMA